MATLLLRRGTKLLDFVMLSYFIEIDTIEVFLECMFPVQLKNATCNPEYEYSVERKFLLQSSAQKSNSLLSRVS